MGKQIKLRHPRYEGLTFGDGADAIRFGLRGGFAPGTVILDEDDHRIPALMAAEPDIVIEREVGEPAREYLCPLHPDATFKTRAALLSHFRSEAGHEAILAALAPKADTESTPAPVEP